jgi:N-acetylglucosamine kinase-like BadF-type ATPase
MYFLGVDGGQSSTTAVIGDETGRVLGRGEAGPCNHVESESGREKLVAAVTGSIALAAGAAGLSLPLSFSAACFGMSGGAADKREIIAAIVRAGRIEVTHDAHIALLGATAGGPGIVVIAGTGSIAYGQNRAGRTARAGGWGHIFGDEGGGFDIVRQALKAALRQEEGWGPPTVLGQRLCEAAGAPTAGAVLHLFYTREFPRDRVAALAPLVDSAALEGDPVAQNLLQQAAQQLADLAGAVRRQLFSANEPVYVAPVGGVFRSRPLAQRFRVLVELEPGSIVRPPKHEPAIGALIAAYSSLGLAPALQM